MTAISGNLSVVARPAVTFAPAVRRMHDVGKSGWALLCALVPVAGIGMVIVWLCRDSEEGADRFA